MKKIVFIMILCGIIILTACNNNADKVYFNRAENYINSGARLVEPVVINKTDFLSKYNIDLDSLTSDKNYSIQYRLDYKLDRESLKADLSSLINGAITVTENGNVIFVMYLSYTQPIAHYNIDSENIKNSLINNIETQLYDLSNNETDLFYGEFELNGYYITCSMYDKTKNDMIDFLTKLSSDNLLAETE